MGFFIPNNMTSLSKLYEKFCEATGFTTDTRNIKKGNIFFALKGDNFNGNTFAKKALDLGCSCVVVDEKQIDDDERYFLVDNVLTTLQQLATHHRTLLKTPIIALTGSNGKTTTKELIACVLEKKFNILATKGNLNNHIGVPLTLLSLNRSHELAVIEMGANHQGEIKALCEIAKPNMGLITNIGRAHLEGFGGIEGVIKGKTEMYAYLQSHNATVFYNHDNELLKKLVPKNISLLSYGRSPENYCSYTAIENNKYAGVLYDNSKIISQLQGQHQYENIAVALCIGKYFEIPSKTIAEAISLYIPENNRSQELKTDNNTILLDAYNANPTSMKVALEHFLSKSDKDQLVILGDMFELGEYSKIEHQAIIKLLKSNDTNCMAILVGKAFYELKTDDSFQYFEKTEDCYAYLKTEPIKKKSILIKGSRSMKLESLTELL